MGMCVNGYLAAAAAWGRGKKGGLSEYARVVGRDKAVVSRNKSAAMVIGSINRCDVATLLDKANHLAAIHKAPADDWQWLGYLFRRMVMAFIQKKWFFLF